MRKRKLEEEVKEKEDSDDESENPYVAVKTATKPNKVTTNQILEKMEELHEKEMKKQNEQFEILSRHLSKSETQKERLIDILASAFYKPADK